MNLKTLGKFENFGLWMPFKCSRSCALYSFASKEKSPCMCKYVVEMLSALEQIFFSNKRNVFGVQSVYLRGCFFFFLFFPKPLEAKELKTQLIDANI